MAKQRVLLKLGGEALGSKVTKMFHGIAIDSLGQEIVSNSHTHQFAIVVGGGNIFRGDEIKIDESLYPPNEKQSPVPDYMGMLATVQNGILLQDLLERRFDLEIRVMNVLDKSSNEMYEPWIPRRAKHHLNKDRIVILVGGTGNPGFSTDMAMVLRAHQIDADIVLKGTKVDGIYDKDPIQYPDAKFIREITHSEYVKRGLKIIDTAAVEQARKFKMGIGVFNLFKKDNLRRVLTEKDIGSVIH